MSVLSYLIGPQRRVFVVAVNVLRKIEVAVVPRRSPNLTSDYECGDGNAALIGNLDVIPGLCF
jgi:hypothetical protein